MFSNDGKHIEQYVYDFSVDGGAAGAINLHAKERKSVIPVGAIIKAVTAKVLTTLTSGGSATLAWGNGDDADGYSGTTAAVAGFAALTLFNGWDNAAALIWDDTNDHQIPLDVSTAADGQFIFTITTADLTAGKMVFMVEYLLPSIEA